MEDLGMARDLVGDVVIGPYRAGPAMLPSHPTSSTGILDLPLRDQMPRR
jgi:hypothetical protein